MTDLTKKESAYFICFAVAALGVIIMTLVLWSQTQPRNCWTQYETEQQAIAMCEQ
jgi:hypothetical protein